MFVNTKGIVLRVYPFKDNSVIAKIFTENYGLVSFIVKKTKSQIILAQPLTIADITYKQSKSKSLYYVKDVSVDYVYNSVMFQNQKLNCCIVLCEILTKCVKEINPKLYNFIKNSFIWLDKEPLYHIGFDTLFLIKLCELMGISPFNSVTNNFAKMQLDVKEGVFIDYKKTISRDNNMIIPEQESMELYQLARLTYLDLKNYNISTQLNDSIFDYMILYISNHLVDMHNLKSIKILKELSG